MKNIILITLILTTILSSCRKKLDIKIPKGKEHIVVNGINTNDSLIKINISKSQDILNNDKIESLTNATVKLYNEDIFIENLTHTENGYYLSTFTPKIGEQYKISVSSGELKTVKAKMQLNEPVKITSIDTTVEYLENNNDFGFTSLQYKIHYKIKLNDEPNKKNYYFLALSATIPRYDYDEYPPVLIGYFDESTYFDTNDIIFNNENVDFTVNGIYGKAFTDELFDGKQYTIDITSTHYKENFDDGKDYNNWQVKVKLLTISEDIYNYIVSFNLNQQTEYDPFAQPVQIYTNVEDGLGLFSAYTTTIDSLSLDFMNK